MTYVKFLLKNTISVYFLLSYILIALLASFLGEKVFSGVSLVQLLSGINMYCAFFLVIYTYYIDTNNNMISRLVMNGGSRYQIWGSKLGAVMISVAVLIAIQFIVVTFRDGMSQATSIEFGKSAILQLQMTLFMTTVTSVLYLITKNGNAVMFILFLYISPLCYSVLYGIFENSKYLILRKNPFYLNLKMYKSFDISVENIVIVVASGVFLWLCSFLCFLKMDLKK